MSEGHARGPAPTLRVQTVLFHNARDDVVRFTSSVVAACEHALDGGAVCATELAIGDSSEHPLSDRAEDFLPDGPHPFSSVDYLHFGENLGSAGGHNRLFQESRADIVLVMNPDTYASPRLVTELVRGLADSSVGVVEARQLPLEHPKAHDPVTGDTSWASGSCVLVRAEVVAATNGFDTELFFLHGDDVDFSWRARLAGWRVVHRPSARVFHDKRLDDNGGLRPSERELEFSARAHVLLPWRYSRRDLALARLAALESSPERYQRRIAAELRAKIDAGDMPEPIDPDHRVAQFVGDEYATHRFSYSDP